MSTPKIIANGAHGCVVSPVLPCEKYGKPYLRRDSEKYKMVSKIFTPSDI